ncbi:MAG: sulfatase-like hydrolase/transferase [Bacteroidetes bacterium]|nr:sulfatase-like hydrolase/transferase [Bacteroidota bacterium]
MFATDDLNTWINPLGYNQAITPNLDRLAERGITFTNAHAPAAYCAPSRSAIWSGLHASSTGCYNDELYFYDNPELVSMQTAFDQAGYLTYGAGKLYHHRAGSFDTRGWDAYFSRSQEIRDWGYEMGYRGSDVPWPDPRPYSPVYTDPRSNRYLEPGETIDYGAFLEWGPISSDKAELIPDAVRTNWVCNLLDQEHTDPFFIGLGLYTPHFPNYAPQAFFDMYDRDSIIVPYIKEDDLDDLPDHIRNRMTNRLNIQANLVTLDAVENAVIGYLACVSFADAMLGRVLDALDSSAYKDNTVVIFWSDQGYHHGEKGQWGKHTLWQETSHVPFIFAGNGLPENKRVSTSVSLIDMYPTLIELCNLPEQHQMDGESLVPVLHNPESAIDRNVFMTYMEKGGYALINSNWRYIQYHDGSEEFYDLNNDPNEWYNLASDQGYRDIINEMKLSAPSEFHADATQRNTLNLVIENDSFYWEPKDKSRATTFINGSIIFTNPIRQQGISFVEITNRDSVAFTEQVINGEQDCRYIPENKFCYFKVDDQYFNSDDSDITFHITYFDDSNSNFELQYNSTGPIDKSIVIAKTSTNQWQKKTIMVADAAFNNQLNYQSDFRLTGEVNIRSISIDKPLPSDVSVVFADQIIENGMEFVVGTDPTKETYTEKVAIGGHECRLISYADKRKYGYFKANDTFIKPADNRLTFEVTYYDSGTKALTIQYNAISGTNPNYKKADITRTNTNTWMTKSFIVTDAALDNKQNNQSDFRIMGEAYIRRVALRIGSEIPEAPEIPVENVIPKETENPVGTRQIELPNHNVKVWFNEGMLSILIPDEMIKAELRIYNIMGQEIYRTRMTQTEESVNLPSDSNFYIVVIQDRNTFTSKKIIASNQAEML